MTEYTQWTTMLIAVLVLFVIALGIWLIVKQIIEDDIVDHTNREVDELVEDLYLSAELTPVVLLSSRFKVKDPR